MSVAAGSATTTVGRVMALGSGLSFGTVGIFSKLFYERGGHPFELTVIRIAGGALLLCALVVLRRRLKAERGVLLFGLSLGIFQAGTNYALLEGFDRAPAALIVLLYYIYPLVVTIAGSFLFGEDLGLRQGVAVALGLGGIALTVGTPSEVPVIGIVLGLVAGVCAASFVLGARHVMAKGAIEAVEMLALMLVGPGIGFTLAAAARGFAQPSGTAAGYAVGLVVIGTVVAPLLFFSSVKRVGAGTASLLASVEPFVAVVLAYVILDESLTALQLVGGALLLGAVLTLSLPAGALRPLPAPRTP